MSLPVCCGPDLTPQPPLPATLLPGSPSVSGNAAGRTIITMSLLPRNSKQRTAIIAGAAVVAVVVIFLLFRTILGSFGSVDEYTVPNVTGMTQEEAEDLLEEQGLDTIFTLDYQGSEESDVMPETSCARARRPIRRSKSPTRSF